MDWVFCLRCQCDAEQIEAPTLYPGGGGEDVGEPIVPEAHDIACEGSKISEQGMKAVHRKRFAICGIGALAGSLALRRRRGLRLSHG